MSVDQIGSKEYKYPTDLDFKCFFLINFFIRKKKNKNQSQNKDGNFRKTQLHKHILREMFILCKKKWKSLK